MGEAKQPFRSLQNIIKRKHQHTHHSHTILPRLKHEHNLWHRLLVSGPEKKSVTEEALRLSLKYNFVTPLTSMVVTKPLGETTDVLHKPKEGETPPDMSAYDLPTKHHSPPMHSGWGSSGRMFSTAYLRKQDKCAQNRHNAKSVVWSHLFSTFSLFTGPDFGSGNAHFHSLSGGGNCNDCNMIIAFHKNYKFPVCGLH